MTDTTRHDMLTPTEAAARLGITPDAVRARLRRGTLPGEQRGHEWVVFLPAIKNNNVILETADPPIDANHINTDRHDADTTHRATRHDSDTMPRDGLLAAKDETIARQDAEIAYLRAELSKAIDQAAAERERADVLHREALQRIEALTAGHAAEQPPAVAHPEASPNAPSATEAAARGSDTPEPESWFLSAWRRLRGRS